MPNPLLRDRQLDTDVQRPNLCSNGGFEIWQSDWQGTRTGDTSATPAANNVYFCDQWLVSALGSSQLAPRRETTVRDPLGGATSCMVTWTYGNASGQVLQWTHANMPGLSNTNPALCLALAGKTVTFTIRVRCNTPNSCFPVILNGAAWVRGTAHPGDNSWQTLMVTATLDPTQTIGNGYAWGVVFDNVSSVAYLDNAALVQGSIALDPPAIQFAFPDAIPGARIGADLPRLNQAVNGGFEVWQRGNGPFTSGFGPDKWNFNVSAGSTLTASRAAVSAGLTAPPGGMSTAMVALSFNAVGSNQYGGLTQAVGNDPNQAYNLIGPWLSMSAWMLCNDLNAHAHLEINSIGFGIFRSREYSTAGTWQLLTVTAPIAQFGSIGIFLTATTAATVYVDNLMCVPGTVPAMYTPLHPADELTRCLRYCERVGTEYFEPIGVGTFDTLGAVINISYKVAKPVTPSLTYTPGQFSYYNAASQTWYTPSTVGAVVGGSPKAGVVLRLQGGTYGAAASATVVVGGGGSTAMLVEANP